MPEHGHSVGRSAAACALHLRTVPIPVHPRSEPRVKSEGALTESRREFERFDREGDANARGSRRSPIGPTRTESVAASPDPHLTPESPTFPPPRPAARNRPGRKAKPARFRGPVRSSVSATLTNRFSPNRHLGTTRSVGLHATAAEGPECVRPDPSNGLGHCRGQASFGVGQRVLKPFPTTSRLAPTSATTAIHIVATPPNARPKNTTLMPMAKPMF